MSRTTGTYRGRPRVLDGTYLDAYGLLNPWVCWIMRNDPASTAGPMHPQEPDGRLIEPHIPRAPRGRVVRCRRQRKLPGGRQLALDEC